jgi:hypothetical protein
MTIDELHAHFRGQGLSVETLTAGDGNRYSVIRDYPIRLGSFGGRTCDVALQIVPSVPYVAPPAIHTRPALLPMDTERYRTQPSALGPDWQYWSRLLRSQPTPRAIAAHLATIFSEV